MYELNQRSFFFVCDIARKHFTYLEAQGKNVACEDVFTRTKIRLSPHDGLVRHFNSVMKYELLELTFADLFPCEDHQRSFVFE